MDLNRCQGHDTRNDFVQCSNELKMIFERVSALVEVSFETMPMPVQYAV